MSMLSKREKETLREISKWKEFYANWKPKTRAKLERMNLVANVSPKGCIENPNSAGSPISSAQGRT
ncbi:hypothetical protein ACP8ZO_21090 [Escherichia coli]